MPPTTRSRPATQLRDAHRVVTRSRICEAAREHFFVRGFDGTTMDDIAVAAGVSRSTLYQHFRDKEAVLGEIAADYGSALCEIVDRLPGPVPTRDEIGRWVQELATFLSRERTPAVLINNLAEQEDAPAAVRQIGEQLIAALAARLPAFRQALEPGPGQHLARAWAMVVMRELGWACLQFARDQEGVGKALLIVAGDILDHFVRSHSQQERPNAR